MKTMIKWLFIARNASHRTRKPQVSKEAFGRLYPISRRCVLPPSFVAPSPRGHVGDLLPYVAGKSVNAPAFALSRFATQRTRVSRGLLATTNTTYKWIGKRKFVFCLLLAFDKRHPLFHIWSLFPRIGAPWEVCDFAELGCKAMFIEGEKAKEETKKTKPSPPFKRPSHQFNKVWKRKMKQFASLQATVRTQQTARVSKSNSKNSEKGQKLKKKKKTLRTMKKPGVAKTMTGIHGKEKYEVSENGTRVKGISELVTAWKGRVGDGHM